MTFSLQVLKMGECDVAGPEVFWMSHWHEWVTLHFWMVVIRGPGVTAIVNTGPPSDLADLNARWHAAFGARGEMRREERERPLNALAGLGVRPEDVTHVLVTPLQSYATANIQLFPNARVCLSKRDWIEDFHAEKFPMHVSRWHRIPRDTLQYLMFEGWERVHLLEDEDEVVLVYAPSGSGCTTARRCVTSSTRREARWRSATRVFTYRNLEAGEPLGAQESLEEFHRACARIKRESTLFIPLYEPEVWRRHPGGRVA